jgi:hypothetical protein
MHAYEMSYKWQLYLIRTVATWIFVHSCHIWPQSFWITQYVFIDSEVNFACSFYNNYKFSVAQKMLCTPWSFNILKIVLSQLSRKRPRRHFFSQYVKKWFHGLDIQITVKWSKSSSLKIKFQKFKNKFSFSNIQS